MASDWPEAVARLEVFLEKAGLVLQHREEYPESFDNKILQYGNATIGIRVGSDRSFWYVDVADIAGRPDEWYDVPILRDLLLGPGDDVLPLSEQIKFVEANWWAIVSRFGPAQREETHARLESLRNERARRRFPNLYSQNPRLV